LARTAQLALPRIQLAALPLLEVTQVIALATLDGLEHPLLTEIERLHTLVIAPLIALELQPSSGLAPGGVGGRLRPGPRHAQANAKQQPNETPPQPMQSAGVHNEGARGALCCPLARRSLVHATHGEGPPRSADSKQNSLNQDLAEIGPAYAL
jgi:hypothetical protein